MSFRPVRPNTAVVIAPYEWTRCCKIWPHRPNDNPSLRNPTLDCKLYLLRDFNRDLAACRNHT